MTPPVFIDHEIVRRTPNDYTEMQLHPDKILKAWALSLFAHEVLEKNGAVKTEDKMSDTTLEKFISARHAFEKGEEVTKPVIGVGIMDNIEIGIGREIVAAAKIMSLTEIPVIIRKSQLSDIEKLLKQMD